MTPWSVSPRAGCSKAAARSARASILHAPSSSEYSECTWRWTAGGTAPEYARGRREPRSGAASRPLFARSRAASLVALGRDRRREPDRLAVLDDRGADLGLGALRQEGARVGLVPRVERDFDD